MKHETTWGLEVSPVGRGAVPGADHCQSSKLKRQLQVEQRHVYSLNSPSLKTGVSDWKQEN